MHGGARQAHCVEARIDIDGGGVMGIQQDVKGLGIEPKSVNSKL